MATKAELVVEGKSVPVSNLDKVLYPAVGFTKAQVIDYYIRIAPVLLPHLQDRPLSLKRYPDGVEGGFSMKNGVRPTARNSGLLSGGAVAPGGVGKTESEIFP